MQRCNTGSLLSAHHPREGRHVWGLKESDLVGWETDQSRQHVLGRVGRAWSPHAKSVLPNLSCCDTE